MTTAEGSEPPPAAPQVPRGSSSRLDPFGLADRLRSALASLRPPTPESTRRVAWSVVAFAIVVASLTFLLRPYDTYNVGLFLFMGSYVAIGQSPYAVFGVPPPANLQLLTLAGYWTYNAAGSQFWAPVVLYKFANAFSILGTAVLLRSLVLRHTRSERLAAVGFVAYLLSPCLAFYSFVHLELDAVAIFLCVLAIYLFYGVDPLARGDAIRRLVGGLVLGLSIYMYLFPIAIAPTLILYESTWRKRFAMALVIVVGVAAYAVPYLLLGFYSPSNPNATIGTSGPASAYSIEFVLNLPEGFGEGVSTVALFAILLLGFTLVLWRIRASRYASMFIGMTLALVVVPIFNADEFVWILPFLTLTLLVEKDTKITTTRMLLIGLLILPELLVFNFYDGLQSMGTGIFYLFYPQFGVPIDIWRHIPHASKVAQVLMASTFLLMGAFCLKGAMTPSVVEPSLGSGSPGGTTVPTGRGPGARKDGAPGREGPGRGGGPGRLFRGPFRVPVAALALLLAITVVFSTIPSTTSSTSPTEFPTGIFLDHPPIANNASVDLVDHGQSAFFPVSNPAIPSYFAYQRDVGKGIATLDFDVNASVHQALLYNTTVFRSAGAQVDITSRPDLVGATTLGPTTSYDLGSPSTFSGAESGGRSFLARNYTGDSNASYDLTGLANGSTYSLFVHAVSFPDNQSEIWAISTNRTEIEFRGVELGSGTPEFSFQVWNGSGRWSQSLLAPSNGTAWDVSQFRASQGYLSMWLNDVLLGRLYVGDAPVQLTLGALEPPRLPAGNLSFLGVATDPIVTAGPFSTSAVFEVLAPGKTNLAPPYSRGEFDLSSDNGQLNISLDGSPAISLPTASWIVVGRLGNSVIPLLLTVTSYDFSTGSEGNLLPAFLFLSLGLPLWGVGTVAWVRRWELSSIPLSGR